MSTRTISVVGARPQFVKLAPVARAMAAARERHGVVFEDFIVHTGQHYDASMSDVFFSELEIPKPDLNIGVGSGTHAAQTAVMMTKLEQLFAERRPDAVIVYGDTNSTLAGALAAAKLVIPVVHVEAGLRSFNRAMPEEINRIVSDHVSDLLLAPTQTALRHLAHEGLAAKTRLTGDVMHDAVAFCRERALRQSSVLERFGLTEGEFALITVHRAENTTPDVLRRILAAFEKLAADGLRMVFPVHPRTRKVIETGMTDWRPPPGLELVEPLGYLDNLRLLAAARLALTDSGGLQKEALFCGTPCVTLREETEWPETLEAGGNMLTGSDPDRIVAAAGSAMRPETAREDLIKAGSACFGAGDAASRIVAEILEFMQSKRPEEQIHE